MPVVAEPRRVLVTGGAGFAGYPPTISPEDGDRRTWPWFQESVFRPSARP